MHPAWTFDWRAKAMSTNSERIISGTGATSSRPWPLHDALHTRLLEVSGIDNVNYMSQMQTAGLALAKLTLALVPHARVIWIACGPGNNGGDGFEAATQLHRWGKQVVVSLVHDPQQSPKDARFAWKTARSAGVRLQTEAPPFFDVCIDALFGIGTLRPIAAPYASWVERMNASTAPTIAVDIPSGLNADTGETASVCVCATYTLSLLSLKPGLFTAGGRDASGEIWFNNLDAADKLPTQAVLAGPSVQVHRKHASHKGSYGDVAVVGGAAGMTGAAVLAGHSALKGGAGRVFVCLLDAADGVRHAEIPELMFRGTSDLNLSAMTIVAGCGGGEPIFNQLPMLLRAAKSLVLDADALNHIARSSSLQDLIAQRSRGSTVITPHPLEAARLLGSRVGEVQADRLTAAQKLADRFQCVVVLKGSGTVIAAPDETPYINPTGNAKLASAGTGDVLAGLTGAYLAQGHAALSAACAAVYQHGLAADLWQGPVLNATELCQQL